MIEQAKRVLAIEAAAVHRLIERIDGSFEAAARLILASSGRAIITGMGKSGHVGRKIAATMASTGTPALYLHPAEGIHGDLGMVTAADVVIALSYSGETNEVINILPALKRLGVPLIAICGRCNSTLANNADVFLDIAVAEEACPLGLAPTASTTATLAMGDALAVALLSERKFTPAEFALYHPGGSLGRKLLLTVEKVMHGGDDIPFVGPENTVKEALFVITAKGLGAAVVAGPDKGLQGIITDGDIRRGLEGGYDFLNDAVAKMMTQRPKTVSPDKLAAQALHIMENNRPRPITVLPVVDENNRVQGLLHITDLLRQGVV